MKYSHPEQPIPVATKAGGLKTSRRLKPSSKILRWREFFDTEDFPICVFRMPFHSFSDYEPHLHEFDELVLITGGTARHVFNKKTYEIERGDVFYIPKGESHSLISESGTKLELINILFDFSKLPINWSDLATVGGYEDLFQVKSSVSSKFDQNRNYLHLNAADLAQSIKFVNDIEWELAKQERGFRFMTMNYFSSLMGFLARRHGHITTHSSRSAKKISFLRAYLEEHLTEDISVKLMSQVSGMSQSGLRKCFQDAFSESPIHYLQRLRVDRSLELMADADKSITEIAFAVGFQDSNYFARIFQRVMGQSPSRYRLTFH